MANEAVWSSLSSDVGRTVVESYILEALADEYFIANHPAIMDMKDLTGSFSDTAKVREDDVLTGRTFNSVSEGGSMTTNTAIGTELYSVAIGQKYLQWNISDLLNTLANEQFSPERFAQGLAKSLAYTWTGLLATEGATFTGSLDAGAGDPDLEDFWDAVGEVEDLLGSGDDPGIAILHPKAARALAKDGNFAQQSNLSKDDPGVQALAKMFGTNRYLGRIHNFDIFATPQVATDTGKYQNCLFRKGGMLKAMARAIPMTADQLAFGPLMLERLRSSTKPETTIRGTGFMGVNKAQERGILWETTA
jgi:hypothetical protein